MASAEIAVETTVSESDWRRVLAGLVAYNNEMAGPTGYQEFMVSLREAGELRGALIGRIGWTWLFVDMFWIDPVFRGQGYGAELLQQGEAQARSRGCTDAYLDTFTFQAPGFYAKFGYREFGRLPEYPVGHARIFLTKRL